MKYFATIFIVSIVLGVSLAAPTTGAANTGDVGEFGQYFEGDMLLTDYQRLQIEKGVSHFNAVVDLSRRWPDGVVVYHINETDFDENQLKMINAGITAITGSSCVEFRKRETDDEHAVIIQGSAQGCFSTVGYNNGGRQIINLGSRCFRHGTIVHEMLHSLGFYHMQSTYNRDDYVTIEWDNIKEEYKNNFQRYTEDTVTAFNVTYDYGSVLHYPDTAFSKNGNKTIVPKEEGVEIGQRRGMSEKDISKLNKMYCEESKRKPGTGPAETR